MATGLTGLAYDARCLLHAGPKNAWETPARLEKLIEKFRGAGLMQRCTPVPVREATQEEILTTHTPLHIHKVGFMSASDF